MFVETEFTPGSTNGICALCHSGPRLNQTSRFNFAAPPGARIANIGVSERNLLNLPVYTFLIDDGLGDLRAVTSPDLGIPLTNPRPPGVPPPFVRYPAFFANFFKIPSLWGVKKTAPYFHGHSAKTLEEVAAFYTNMLATNPDFPLQLTPQDEIDMVAYLKLLRVRTDISSAHFWTAVSIMKRRHVLLSLCRLGVAMGLTCRVPADQSLLENGAV